MNRNFIIAAIGALSLGMLAPSCGKTKSELPNVLRGTSSVSEAAWPMYGRNSIHDFQGQVSFSFPPIYQETYVLGPPPAGASNAILSSPVLSSDGTLYVQ